MAALLIGAATWTSAALGQGGLGPERLPPEIVASTTQLGGAQREAIRTFVAAHQTGLASPEAATLIPARTALLEPLRASDVGVSFRSAYSEELEKVLAPLIGHDSDLVAVNALRLAGELSTRQGAALLERSLASKKVTVRYAAVAGIGRTFENLARTAPAMNVDTARDLARKLTPVLRGETESHVFDAAVRAVIAAGALDREGWGSLRDDAIGILAPAVSDRLQKQMPIEPDPAMLQAFIRACSAARDTLAISGGRPLGAESQKLAAGMGGDALAYLQRLIKAKLFPNILPEDVETDQEAKRLARTTIADFAAVAYACVAFANDGLGGPDLPAGARNLSELLRSARAQDDARFLEGVRDLVGPEGTLTRPPYSFPRERFAR